MKLHVACAIIVHENLFLLARRPLHKHQGGKWEFPGGKIQEGETAEACVIREIMEELELNVKVTRKLDAVTHSYPAFTLNLHPFLCVIRDGSLRLTEHSETRWVDLSAAALLDVCDADKKVLQLLAAMPQ